MLCSQVRKSFYSYAAGETNELENFLIKEHLDSCPSCRVEYERMTEIKSILTNIGRRTEAPYDLAAGIMGAIDLERYKAVGIYAINSLKSWGISLITAGMIIAALNMTSSIDKSFDQEYLAANIAKIQENVVKPFEIFNKSVIDIADRISDLNHAMSLGE